MNNLSRTVLAAWVLEHRGLLAMLGLALLVIGVGLGFRDPWPADEPRFALIARDMVTSGNWLIPKVGGDLYPDKPPVFFWLIAGFYFLTGSLRTSFLLPSLFAALGTLVLVYDLARRLWDRRVAWHAAAVLLVTLQFVMQARMGRIDATVTFFITLGLYGLLRHLLLGPDWRWYWAGCFFTGLGIITKGVGFLPLLILLPWAVAKHGNWKHLPRFNGSFTRWAIGPMAMLLAVSVWLLPMLAIVAASGDPQLQAYRDEILFRQTAERYVEGWHHANPAWYYFTNVIPQAWLPLSLLLIWLIPGWWRQLACRDARFFLPLAWTLLVVLFFSIAEGKRGVYILPALPALALAAGPHMPELTWRKSVRYAVGGLLLGLVAWLLLFMDGEGHVSDAFTRYTNTDLKTVKLVFGVGMMLVLGIGYYRDAVTVLLMATVLTWVLIGGWVAPAANAERIPREVMLNAHRAAGARQLGIVHWKAQHLLYSPREVTHFGFRREDHGEELRDGIAWLLGEPARALMVPNDVAMRCFKGFRMKPLGYSNRHSWFLIDEDGITQRCRRRFRKHEPDRVFNYRVPVKGIRK